MTEQPEYRLQRDESQLPDVHVWHCAVPDNEMDHAVLCETEIAAIDKFAFARDRRRFVATRNFVRSLLSRYGSLEPAAWRFVTNDYGKPAICPKQSANLHFNISHTKSRIVCAVAAFSDIGVDIEDKIPDEFRKLAKKFFSPDECDWLGGMTDEHAARGAFLSLWTLKEAFIKAIGKGMYIPLTSFCVIPQAPNGAELTCTETQFGSWEFRRFVIEESRIAVAFPMPDDHVRCELTEFKFD